MKSKLNKRLFSFSDDEDLTVASPQLRNKDIKVVLPQPREMFGHISPSDEENEDVAPPQPRDKSTLK